MTDKVQKILSEIAARKLCTMDEHMAFYNDKAKEDYWLLSEIEEFIKASQEESVSEDLETEIDKIDEKYRGLNSLCEHDVIEICEHFCKFGADWQKERTIKKACEYLKDNIYRNLYCVNGETGFPTAEFIKDLRKYLEE